MLIEIKKMFVNFINLPRALKASISISIDFASCALSIWLAYYLRLGYFSPLDENGIRALVLVFFVYFPIFYLFGFYKAISRYYGLTAFLRVAKAIIIYGIFYFSIICVIGLNNVPRTVGLIQPLILFIFVSSWRLIAQFLLRSINNKKVEKKDILNALVYGSGNAGRQLFRAMQESSDILIKGFIESYLVITNHLYYF